MSFSNKNQQLFSLNRYITNVVAFGINLKERKDKRKNLMKICSRREIPLNMFITERHPTNPKRGCLESHLQIIKEAYSKKNITGAKNLLIFEDDLKFIGSFSTLKQIPKDYDMLYFGGTVHRKMDEKDGWVQMSCWTTHAYLINLEKDEMVNKIINDLEKYNEEIDRYYLNEIHTEYKAYMCNPMICIQENGFSDIEGKEVDYSFMQQTLNGLRTPEYSVGKHNEYILKLPNISDEELPKVSIVTPTRNRSHLFSIALRNYELFNYPRNKLEWVIVEDGNENVSELIPKPYLKSGMVKYVHLGNELEYTIASKRNIGVQESTSKYIVHMDDDDYYPPESILARIKILLKYEKDDIECVGCTLIGTYNLLSDTSSMSSDGMLSLSEASMAYTKHFWEMRAFDGDCVRGEHKSFCEGRLNKIMDIPYSFVIIAFNHKKNFSEIYRCDNGVNNINDKKLIKIEGKVANFFDMWDIDTQLFVEELRGTLL